MKLGSFGCAVVFGNDADPTLQFPKALLLAGEALDARFGVLAFVSAAASGFGGGERANRKRRVGQHELNDQSPHDGKDSMKIYGDQGTFRAKSRFGTPKTGLGVAQAPSVVARTTPMRATRVSTVSAAVSRGASGQRYSTPVKTYERGGTDKKPVKSDPK